MTPTIRITIYGRSDEGSCHDVAMTQLDEIATRLRAAGCVFAEDEAELLIDEADSADELEAMVARRVGGEPLEYVLGWAEFCGLRIIVQPGVFVPRRRTEVLVTEAGRLARPGAIVVDLCCGAGAIGAALLATCEGIDLHAADIDPAAVACAQLNLEPDGGHVFEGDLFAALPAELKGRVDIVVVNAPYVPTDAIAMMPPEAREYEGNVALDGGADGVDIHRRVGLEAAEWVASDGYVLIETSQQQAPLTIAALEAGGFVAWIERDEEVDGTAVIGTHPV
jgi:release factor glutamine methyltransferase